MCRKRILVVMTVTLSDIRPGNRVLLERIWWPGCTSPGHLVFWHPAMPLQNRVNPFGELTAVSARGLFMGNRGGRIHDLDEVTALAAGHRPCFECRRQEAEHFATLFAGNAKRVSAPVMDKILHGERLDGKAKRTRRGNFDALPDGAVIVMDGQAFAMRGAQLLRWTPVGYDKTRSRPSTARIEGGVSTSTFVALGRGYAPRWHPSAD